METFCCCPRNIVLHCKGFVVAKVGHTKAPESNTTVFPKRQFRVRVQLRKAAQLAHRTPIQHSVDSVLDSVRKFSSRSAGLCGWEKSRASTARLAVVMLCLSAGVCCCFRGLIWKIGRNHQRHITIMRNAVNYRFQFFFEGFCCGKGSKWKYFPSSMRLTWRQASGSNLYSYIEQHFCPQKEAKNRFPKQQWCLFSGCYFFRENDATEAKFIGKIYCGFKAEAPL